jgi:hypothetical protein
MNNRGFSWLVGAIVLALIATACTYEMPTASVLVDEQGGSGGTGGANSSSSGPMGSQEDCLDGIDNDEDGAIDCADSDCIEGFTCEEVLPEGWTRVLVEYGVGEPPAEVPCASGDIPETLFTNPAGPAECDACECGPLEGTTCRPRSLVCFPNSSTCSGTNLSLTAEVAAAECTKPYLNDATTISCRVPGQPNVDQKGGCEPTVADFSNKYSWNGWVRACPDKTPQGGGCLVGSCIPKSTPGTSTCIRKDGPAACPDGWTTTEAYASALDDRGCSECTCTPEAQCIGGGYEFIDFDSCDMSGSPTVTILGSTCMDATNLPDSGTWSIMQILPDASGSCVAGGGAPTGSVVPEKPITFCCK